MGIFSISFDVNILAMTATNWDQRRENVFNFGGSADINQILTNFDRLRVFRIIKTVIQPVKIAGSVYVSRPKISAIFFCQRFQGTHGASPAVAPEI